MPFLQKKFVFEETIEIDKYYTPRYNIKGEKRRKKYQPTPEQMRVHNKKQAEKRLRRLIKANFANGDWHLTLTYDKNNRPTPEQAKNILRNFLNAVRRYCKKNGIEFKWIVVTEYQNVAIHHHIIINGFENVQEVCMNKWKYNTNWSPLYEAERVETLAEYLIKETEKTFRIEGACEKQRYSCSRNLKRPEPEVSVCSTHISADPRVPKEYKDTHIMDTDYYYFGISEKTGYASQSIVLRRMSPKEIKNHNNKQKRLSHKRR